MKKSSLRKISQGIFLGAFLILLVFVSLPASDAVADRFLNFFLLSDPFAALVTVIAARSAGMVLVFAVATAAVSLVFGRFFCGYVCPMGTTVDIFDRVIGRRRKVFPLSGVRFVLLAGLAGASFLGVNLAFHFLPISLATRFYGLLLYPPSGIIVSQAADASGLFGYFSFDMRRYAALASVLLFFTVLFVLSRYTKRFWCKYICPSGAFLGLLSRFAPYKRTVSAACTTCGRCEASCPVEAIKGIYHYSASECILCRKCEDVCPERAVRFTFSRRNFTANKGILPGRRELLAGGAAGGFLALVGMSELSSLLNIKREHGAVVYAGLIRPPGAVPERSFLARCIRCGECMVACPTNGLQPLEGESGSAALFSPVLVPERGNCEVQCKKCGDVCPTAAIRSLTLEEKQHAKIGTARVIKERCLAWEEDKACVVCQEVCPYNAMKLNPRPGYTVPVPDVEESRCFGCGACENSCPLAVSAVKVDPSGELRLTEGSYIIKAAGAGLDLTVKEKSIVDIDYNDDGGLPPGFVE